jgi:tetratricopeptide (TPR) repeat protein
MVLMVLLITSSCNEDKKFVNQGNESLKNGKIEEALSFFSKALEVNPKNEEASAGKKKVLLLIEEKHLVFNGNEMLQNGNLEQAQVDFDKALWINPTNKEALLGKEKVSLLVEEKKSTDKGGFEINILIR